MFHCSLGGTIYVYQGQELGMINVPRGWGLVEYKDVETIQNSEAEVQHRQVMCGHANPDISDLLESNRITARDNGRTPMQVGVGDETMLLERLMEKFGSGTQV